MISDYIPENPAEELFELVGRIKAFAAYVNNSKYDIDRRTCADMLGFKLKEMVGEKYYETLPVYPIPKTSEDVPKREGTQRDDKKCSNRSGMDSGNCEIPFTRNELKVGNKS